MVLLGSGDYARDNNHSQMLTIIGKGRYEYMVINVRQGIKEMKDIKRKRYKGYKGDEGSKEYRD